MTQHLDFAERAKAVLTYDSTTGVFRWLVARGTRKPGDLAGVLKNKTRLYIGLEGKQYFAHRLAWLFTYGHFPNGVIDHIDGNPLNNKIENLRDVSALTNSQNQRRPQAHNKSGYLGVSWDKTLKKFVARLKVKGKHLHLGVFESSKDAHFAYLKAKRIHHDGCTI